MSQDELAELVGMTGGNLSLLERGLISYTQDNLEKIAKVIGCSVAELLERAPADPPRLDDVLRDAPAATRRQVIEIARTLLKTDG